MNVAAMIFSSEKILRRVCAQVNTAEFEEAIQDCSTPIIVDIYAVWYAHLGLPQL